MPCEMTELEHIELKMVDGMPVDWWQGVEDSVKLILGMIEKVEKGQAQLSDVTEELIWILLYAEDSREIWFAQKVGLKMPAKVEG
ncbi:MAG: hypothetical protein NT137_01375 [Methanomassiliicoccales archaeon]|nr:hypothetical protein [Methanomassiliicoccales archaeon]